MNSKANEFLEQMEQVDNGKMTAQMAIQNIEAQGFHFDSESMVDLTFIKENEDLKDTKEWTIIKQELNKLEAIRELLKQTNDTIPTILEETIKELLEEKE